MKKFLEDLNELNKKLRNHLLTYFEQTTSTKLINIKDLDLKINLQILEVLLFIELLQMVR